MRAFATAAILTVLAGCAPQYTWVRADATPADFNRDSARCEYEAASSTATYGSSMPAARTLGGAIGQGVGLGIGRSSESSNLIVLCMRSKGYAQAPIGAGQPYPAAMMIQPQSTPTAEPAIYTPPGYYAVPVSTLPGRGDIGPVPTQIGAAPAVAGIKGESKFMLVAEALAKAGGCAPPAAAMTAKGAGQESFMIGCPNGTALAMQCSELSGCRVLR